LSCQWRRAKKKKRADKGLLISTCVRDSAGLYDCRKGNRPSSRAANGLSSGHHVADADDDGVGRQLDRSEKDREENYLEKREQTRVLTAACHERMVFQPCASSLTTPTQPFCTPEESAKSLETEKATRLVAYVRARWPRPFLIERNRQRPQLQLT
jgi:hypothetical protein